MFKTFSKLDCLGLFKKNIEYEKLPQRDNKNRNLNQLQMIHQEEEKLKEKERKLKDKEYELKQKEEELKSKFTLIDENDIIPQAPVDKPTQTFNKINKKIDLFQKKVNLYEKQSNEMLKRIKYKIKNNRKKEAQKILINKRNIDSQKSNVLKQIQNLQTMKSKIDNAIMHADTLEIQNEFRKTIKDISGGLNVDNIIKDIDKTKDMVLDVDDINNVMNESLNGDDDELDVSFDEEFNQICELVTHQQLDVKINKEIIKDDDNNKPKNNKNKVKEDVDEEVLLDFKNLEEELKV